MKTIKIKSTGVETSVSKEYFQTYENDGWFIEVVAPKKAVVATKTKAKEEAKG